MKVLNSNKLKYINKDSFVIIDPGDGQFTVTLPREIEKYTYIKVIVNYSEPGFWNIMGNEKK